MKVLVMSDTYSAVHFVMHSSFIDIPIGTYT
jgi:hypothetical protein